MLLSLALATAAMSTAKIAQSNVDVTTGLGDIIQQYEADRRDIGQLYPIQNSPARRARVRELDTSWRAKLDALSFDSLDLEAKADDTLLHLRLERDLRQLDIDAAEDEKIMKFVPFAPGLVKLEEDRIKMIPLDPEKAADRLSNLVKEVAAAKAAVEKMKKPDQHVADEGVQLARNLKDALGRWFKFYDGYDPMFTWWVDAPYKEADKALGEYATWLREKIVGVKESDENAIVGHPVGREALLADLASEMIPYTPEELIAMAEKEFTWCEAEMRKASQELGYGDNWKAALEHVKTLHVAPGKQPQMIKDLAFEAVDYVKKHDLVTVPDMAVETLRMEMMTPERQLVNPFFLGGPLIIVSYPTESMSQEAKMMSMRANNIHFSRATVQHELIPGHHLQAWAEARFRPYRSLFDTPFWIEGWAVYWETLLWDLGFPRGPEDRIGMLFWRMHRCARIIFSMKFHLGEMTAEQCIQMLVDRVGHDRASAEGEVRRSFNGSYPPLYQAGYLIGAMQFRALHHELVDSGKMTNRSFHDAILRENNIPVAMVRAILTKNVPRPGEKPSWRFLDALPPKKD